MQLQFQEGLNIRCHLEVFGKIWTVH